ncbi:leucine--tRNA ligase [Fulvivirgaceae bacterium BMA10]|uniref:Leucine--tRNA ligase n=1 Tax=Splendidivirga corallicola TaxID=3051826 RepID=A0ABT8KK40_9BACT|nr:leucine--tRNA ligase [Fulvivirgaceae bacterium BMA10]
MAEYNFRDIEKKWQTYWQDNASFKADVDKTRPKFYALDMFPYPSGAGLHVGHPLGYIASDIVSRYKRIKGYNVLHPMGFDAFGLPAEQYAIQTGQHPAITTAENIVKYKEQLKNIGFSFDWAKEVQTCDPSFYRWTQWIFMQLFDSWYDYNTDKARHIDELIALFEKEGNSNIKAECDEDVPNFGAAEWNAFSFKEQQNILLKYRITYLAETTVNWCPELGTVLSNDEVKDGFSERGGFPVIRKNMMQWSMRITAYAERLLDGLERIDWPEPLKEMQRNWIGRSNGAEVDFRVENTEIDIKVFTTRIDTIYGVTYLAIAPESDLVDIIISNDKKQEIKDYVEVVKNRSERERMSDVKHITGVFTGAYALHPFTNEQVPIWVADYVLAGYGTGAVMAVPSGDQRDYDFAKHFDLPIVPIYDNMDISEHADPTKEGKMINSGILDGLGYQQAVDKAVAFIEEKGIGSSKINYRIRDAIFARQRYWGEPVPVYFKDSIPHLVDEKDLPVILPEVDKYLPTEDGDPPLGRAENFNYTPEGSSESYPLELSTMPGWAGSSWYWFRYMDALNDKEFVGKEAEEYWRSVDLYIGGSEHATGHLLYSRFWCKFLYDMGFVKEDEPFKKLINQGMIQGRSNFVYRISGSNKFVSYNLKDDYETSALHVDVNMVTNDILDIEKFKQWRPDLSDVEFILEDGQYICGSEVEKMSKSKYNVVNPDDIIEKYGADTLRLYEMFLGPLEQFKPWNTNGIDGVFKFLRKFWNLFHDDQGNFVVSDDEPAQEALKTMHQTIKKVEEDIEKFSFNTSVSSFMICANELARLKCNNRAILTDFVLILSPYAPHVAEELWQKLGHSDSLLNANFPAFNEAYIREDSYEYPVSVNGKMRTKMSFPLDMPKEDIEREVLASEVIIKWTEGKQPKKVIVVPKRIVNVVV